MKINNALIMAAGRGQRMMPLTEYIPKPMITLNGISLIARGIENLKKFIPNIHITVGYKGEMLASHVTEHGVSTIINTNGQTNSWWLYNSLLKYLNEPLLVLTCDNVLELDFEFLEKDYYDIGAPPCMIVPVEPVKGLEGDFIFHKGRVVTEITRQKESLIYSSGVQVINPSMINKYTRYFDGSNFYDVWNQLIEKEQLLCSKIYPDRWFSIDNLDQLEKAKKF